MYTGYRRVLPECQRVRWEEGVRSKYTTCANQSINRIMLHREERARGQERGGVYNMRMWAEKDPEVACCRGMQNAQADVQCPKLKPVRDIAASSVQRGAPPKSTMGDEITTSAARPTRAAGDARGTRPGA